MAVDLQAYGYSDVLIRAGRMKPTQLDFTIRRVIHAPTTFSRETGAQLTGDGSDGNALRLPPPASPLQKFAADDGQTTIDGMKLSAVTNDTVREAYVAADKELAHWKQIRDAAYRTANDPNLESSLREEYRTKYAPFAQAQLNKKTGDVNRLDEEAESRNITSANWPPPWDKLS